MAQNDKDKAAPAALAEAAPAALAESHLVELVKDGETVFAHPTQVALWLSQGWQEKE